MAGTLKVATGKRRRKLAELVAERIIAEIIRRGWKEGEVLGTEADFLEYFRISRASFREAVRQLEWHGAAGMRRGAQGGLVIQAPPRHAIVSSLKTYFELTQVRADELAATREVLKAAPRFDPARPDNVAIALFLEALDGRSIFELGTSRSASITPKLSETIALRLVADIEQLMMVKGASLGTEAELQRRYQVSRAVLREALRPLELHDIVRVRTGAQGGVIIHECDPDYTIELTTTYLNYARISLSHLWEANSSMAVAAVAGLRGRIDETGLTQLRKALIRLEQASASHYLAAAGEFHRLLANLSGNRVIALFIAVILRYCRFAMPDPDPGFLPRLHAQHRALLHYIEAGCWDEAHDTIQQMFEVPRRWFAKLEKTAARSASRAPA